MGTGRPLTQVSIGAFLHVLLQAFGLLFQPENEGGWTLTVQHSGLREAQQGGKPLSVPHLPQTSVLSQALQEANHPETAVMAFLSMASHLLELSSVPNCKWTEGTGKAPCLSLSWPGGGRAGTKTWQEAHPPAISHLPLLELDTHCCSFPYSLSKSLSTCKASDSSVSGAMTTQWKKSPR